MLGGFKVRNELVEIMRGIVDYYFMNSVFQDFCISDCVLGMKFFKKKKVFIVFFIFFNFKNSFSICIKFCFMVNVGILLNFGKFGFGIFIWSLTVDNFLQVMKSKFSFGGIFDRVDFSVMFIKFYYFDGNFFYYVDDLLSFVVGKIIVYYYLKNVNIMIIDFGVMQQKLLRVEKRKILLQFYVI